MTGRQVRPLPMATGSALLDQLPILDAARRGQGPALRPVSATAAPPAVVELGPGEDDEQDPTAFVLATSGSTGAPRETLLSAANLAASAVATRSRLTGDGAAPQWLLALPAEHVAGLQVLLRTLADGTAPTVLDTAAPFTAAAFLTAAEKMPPGPRVVSLVPTQLHRLLADPEATTVLAAFHAVLVGGAATDRPLREAAAQAGVAVVTTYGMTETCGGCVYDGRPLAGVRVLVDSTDGGPGPVLIRGPVVARGYRGRPGHPGFPGAQTFVTGDLGELDGGTLRIVGRADDMIISGGSNVDPHRVEEVLAGVPGIREALVVGVPDPEWGQAVAALIVPDGAGPPDRALLRSMVTAALGRAAVPRRLLPVDRLPLRGIGKPDRTAALAMLTDRADPGSG